MQKLYGVIGHPIAQSWSPVIHNQLFQLRGCPERLYIALHITPEQLGSAVDVLRANFQGFNVTIPHKRTVIPYLDELTGAARRCGAVNTVHCRNGRLIGHNTDGLGFTAGWKMMGWDIAGCAALLLGAGGAARVVAYELAELGCSIVIGNRTFAKACALAQEVQREFPKLRITAASLDDMPREGFRLVVNATPVGMGDLAGQSPVDLTRFAGVEYVYDLIYNPPQTELLRQAQELGLKVLNGLPMLVYQAARAQEFWLGGTLPEEAVWQVLASVQELKGNA